MSMDRKVALARMFLTISASSFIIGAFNCGFGDPNLFVHRALYYSCIVVGFLAAAGWCIGLDLFPDDEEYLLLSDRNTPPLDESGLPPPGWAIRFLPERDGVGGGVEYYRVPELGAPAQRVLPPAVLIIPPPAWAINGQVGAPPPPDHPVLLGRFVPAFGFAP